MITFLTVIAALVVFWLWLMPLSKTEVERKFTVDRTKLPHVTWARVVQGYLSVRPEIRVRIVAECRCGYPAELCDDAHYSKRRAWITFKGKGSLARLEWEYRLPVFFAQWLINRCRYVVRKHRAHLGRWEVDEYQGPHAGLVVAEIELAHINERVILPEWIIAEVTDDDRYKNKSIAQCLAQRHEGIMSCHCWK